ncbi:MAG: hypothetical protein JWN03_5890 [Nocardia sp.]|uniref:hypothetical protein n=1 Tax=Nocardia sp. TaxID=1821 RepID=UPI00263567C1|nr:hypothetical protein [Nocardia sp.]MCU1645615.1 hypothetical protein [Nocardia sp.]
MQDTAAERDPAPEHEPGPAREHEPGRAPAQEPRLDADAGLGLDADAERGLDTDAGLGLDADAERGLDTDAERGLDTDAGLGLGPEAGRGLDDAADSTRVGAAARRRRIGFVVAAAAFAVLIVLLGWAIPPRPAVISSDRLGPENGEPVAEYLTRARNTLAAGDTDAHWALISFTAGISSDRIPEFSGHLRVSEALYHVPIDRVMTLIVQIPLPAGGPVAVASQRAAADNVWAMRADDDRSKRVQQVTYARLSANCPCLVGLVVQATLPQLRNLAALPGVRAIEALPADASAGVFALAPLLPEQQDLADFGADDGPVPDN